MTRPFILLLTPADALLTGFASNVTGATFVLTTNATSDGLAHNVTVRNDSATDHSGKTIILVGTDQDDLAITETIAAPGSSATVTSTLFFKTLTSATPSATIGADTFDIGWNGIVESEAVPSNWRGGDLGLNVTVTGTINYTVQHTFDSLEDSAPTFTWINHDSSTLVSQTASKNGSYTQLPSATHLLINSFSTGATAEYNILQADG